eukprot:3266378-Amphidinium_carterae.1
MTQTKALHSAALAPAVSQVQQQRLLALPDGHLVHRKKRDPWSPTQTLGPSGGETSNHRAATVLHVVVSSRPQMGTEAHLATMPNPPPYQHYVR